MNLSILLGCVGNASCLVNTLASAIVLAMLLFLLASGLSLIFGVIGFGNFAHGCLYMLGAYATWIIVSHLHSFALALVIAPLALGVVGIIIETTLVRRVYNAPHLYQILLAFGIFLVIDDLAAVVWGRAFKSIPMPQFFIRPPVSVLGAAIPAYHVFIVIMGVAMAVLFWFTLARTKVGKIMTAAGADPEMLDSLGINVRWIYSLVFAVGSLMAGFGGVLASPMVPASPGMGFGILMESFIVMIVGGVGSVGGTVIAALLVGLLRCFGTLVFPDFELGFVYFLVMAVLIFRPWGILGHPVE